MENDSMGYRTRSESNLKCEHLIKLDGIETYDGSDGFERQRPIYYCPKCKEVWER